MSLKMTLEEVHEHQRKHGFIPPPDEIGAATTSQGKSFALPKPKMNKTEAEYALILEAMRHRGEILRWEYEGITLRWADMKYTPDFLAFGVVRQISGEISVWNPYWVRIIEVKGAHIWDRDIVRFKGARAYWPEFAFEMHQKKQREWRRIY